MTATHELEDRLRDRRDKLAAAFAGAPDLTERDRAATLALLDPVAAVYTLGTRMMDVLQVWEVVDAAQQLTGTAPTPGRLPTPASPMSGTAHLRTSDVVDPKALAWSEAQREAVVRAFEVTFGPAGRDVFVTCWELVLEQLGFELACDASPDAELATDQLVAVLADPAATPGALASLLFLAPSLVAEPKRQPLADVLRDGTRSAPVRAAALLLLDRWGLHEPGEPGSDVRRELSGEVDHLLEWVRTHARIAGIELLESGTST